MIEKLNPQLKEYIENNILSQYKDFEASHNDKHVKTVIENSFDIVRELNLDVCPDLVYTIAAYHDVGIPFGRSDHHLSSARIMMQDENLDKWFGPDEKQLIKEAIEDHRASNTYPPRSIYGKIVAEADRDLEPYRIVKRCVQYESNAFAGEPEEVVKGHIMEHLIEKYGENGYLKLYLASARNQAGLDTIRGWLKSGEINGIIDSYMHNENEGKSSEASKQELYLELQDEEWPLSYTDHDRQVVRAVVVDDEGWFYFMRANRDDDFGKSVLIETSGGGVEEGENLEEAIKRELLEELGAEVEILRKIGVVSDYYNLIHRHNINNYYLCKVKSFGEKHLTEDEIERYHLSTLKLRFEDALCEYEKCSDSRLGRLIAKRELPVLEKAKEMLELEQH